MKILSSVFLAVFWSFTSLYGDQCPGKYTSQRFYLSGTDNENTVSWDFYCTGGRNSGIWTSIEVPSCWEQQGFGAYNYGRDYHTYGRGYKYAGEEGIYNYEFAVPRNWKNKRVEIIFEGSMTDTEVKINGKTAGPIHQGAFYRFGYEISDKLLYGENNILEVRVSKMSSNQSVNLAERYADYWIFGGVFRPVYLEVKPKEIFSRMAIHARADGSFSADIFPDNILGPRTLLLEILDEQGSVAASCLTSVFPDDSVVTVTCNLEDPLRWTSETPNRYTACVSLLKGKKYLYSMSEKFGFRTIEIRAGDGIYMNGKKIKFKGVNRQSLWPETGRTLSPEINLRDALLIKEMNLNAVRLSHYPTDKEFLDYCDSLGLYVIAELAGWHNAYDTDVGKTLVKEMVVRDVNHPSIVFWSNGNEGGHNLDLVDEFSLYDPSNRPVIHAHHKPGNGINGIECDHYPSYEDVIKHMNDSLILMTTEFLHAQNDGGGGAGLEDFWNLMRESERSAGGFLWALIDEGIVRTDRNNRIDVNRVNAPDGILGPHREKEGSFYAIREIYTPIYIPEEEVDFLNSEFIPIGNRYEFTNLDQCKFKWKRVEFPNPADFRTGYVVKDEGYFDGISLKPGEKGNLRLHLPDKFRDYDALVLEAYDPFDRRVMDRTWKIRSNKDIASNLRSGYELGPISVIETDSTISLSAMDISLIISKKDGRLIQVKNRRNGFGNFGNGPQLVSGSTKLESMSHFSDNNCYSVELKYSGDLKSVRWMIYETGWVALHYEYSLTGEYNCTGISFDFPEDHVISAKWLGNGPGRIWKNRPSGGALNVWENSNNNTQTGYFPWLYPEFKGYFSDISWMELNTTEGKFLLATDTEGLYVRLFDFYSLPGPEQHPELPVGDISFLEHVPPTGSKMSMKINAMPEELGPQSEKNWVEGSYIRTLYFYFGTPEK